MPQTPGDFEFPVTTHAIPASDHAWLRPNKVGQLDGTWVSRGVIDRNLDGRFRLEINKDSCLWIETNKINLNELQFRTDIIRENERIRIERPNNKDVLMFLFSPIVALEILEQSPPPSFLLLRNEGEKLVGTWNGLLAITHGTGHLQEPLKNISKECEFTRLDAR